MTTANSAVQSAIQTFRTQEAGVLADGSHIQALQALGEKAWKLGFELRDQRGLSAIGDEIGRLARLLQDDAATALIAAFGGDSSLRQPDSTMSFAVARRNLEVMESMTSRIEQDGDTTRLVLNGTARPSLVWCDLMEGVRAKFGNDAKVVFSFEDGAPASSFDGEERLEELSGEQRATLLAGLDARHDSIKDVQYKDGGVEIRVGNHFHNEVADAGAQYVWMILGRKIPVSFVRDTQGDEPVCELNNGIETFVQPDGSRTVQLSRKQEADFSEQFKTLGVTYIECNDDGIAVAMPAKTTPAQARKAVAEIKMHIPSDYIHVWIQSGTIATFGERSDAQTFTVNRNQLQGILAYLRMQNPSINQHSIWAWADPNLDYDTPAGREDLIARLNREIETGSSVTTGIVLNVDQAFDPADAKMLADTVRSCMKLPDIPVEVRREVDGSRINDGQGGDATITRNDGARIRGSIPHKDPYAGVLQ